MDYGELLTRTWHIFWRNRILWLYGILPTLVGGLFALPLLYVSFQLAAPEFQAMPESAAVTLMVVLYPLLILAALFAGTFSYAAIMRGAWLADAGGAAVWPLPHRAVMSGFGRFFWRTLVIMLALVLIGVLFSVPGFFPMAASAITGSDPESMAGFGLFMALMLCCIGLLIPVSLLGYLLSFLAISAVVGDDLSVGAAVRRAWEVARRNFGSLLVVGLIMFAISTVISFVISAPITVFMMALVIPVAMITSSSAGSISTVNLAAVMAIFALLIAVLSILSGLMYTYIFAIWPVAYRRLTGRSAA